LEETEQASDPNIAVILELPEGGFKTTLINILRAIMDKVDNMQDQIGNIS